MKKIIIGVFLLISALSFSAERVVKMENAYVDDKGIVYVIGEKTPFTGIVENYKVPPISEGDGVLEGKIPFKNGVVDGIAKVYYPTGKLMSEESYKNGKLDFEATYKDGQLDGVVKKYGENGEVIQQGTFKNGVQVK